MQVPFLFLRNWNFSFQVSPYENKPRKFNFLKIKNEIEILKKVN